MADNTPEHLKTVEDRDREWLESVYCGDKEKDLTPRAVLAGLVFGGLMENTIMMTVAVAASWISSAGLVSAVPALTMLTGYQFVWWQLTLLIAIILYMGLFMAIPLKRQMIQIEPLRFPANIRPAKPSKPCIRMGAKR